jgi:nucleotide-binding universal stress UspA family protein
VELPLRTVIVSTDFSEVGDAAIEPAFRLAADHGARLRLVHVMEGSEVPNPLYAHYHPTPSPDDQRQATAAAEEALRERVPSACRERVPHDILVIHGDPAEAIVRVAEEAGGGTWIVMSSHGRQGVARLVLGSVTDRVAARAPCPVLIVR